MGSFISSTLNTFSMGVLGNQDPQPVVVRWDPNQQDWIPQEKSGEAGDYTTKHAEHVGVAALGWMGVMGAAEGLARGLHLNGGIGLMAVRAAQVGAGALSVATILQKPDEVKVVYVGPDGNPATDENGDVFAPQVMKRSEYEASVEKPV